MPTFGNRRACWSQLQPLASDCLRLKLPPRTSSRILKPILSPEAITTKGPGKEESRKGADFRLSISTPPNHKAHWNKRDRFTDSRTSHPKEGRLNRKKIRTMLQCSSSTRKEKMLEKVGPCIKSTLQPGGAPQHSPGLGKKEK
uniref:Uncharacterized protein n=1 Tax=Physcomitrium patens TaxID=3218 RepID=A0A2K1KXK5_PHYPA|nr:hypothetical protein PHYPA_005507 [Physcomitrium patens]